MILQALYDYYQRKTRDPDPGQRLPTFGLEYKEIPFIIELDADGKPLGITDTRQEEGKKKTAQRYCVPQGVKRSSGVAANLFWDTAEYALGVDTRGKPERVREQHAAFRQRLAELPPESHEDEGWQALAKFYDQYGYPALEQDPAWATLLETNPVISFRLYPDPHLICARPQLQAAAAMSQPAAKSTTRCLVTGQATQAARLHTAIKGVWGAQTSGANIVSFNLDAFTSWNKVQGDNAPVSEAAVFAYTTALNHLLERDSRQRIQVGDASTVFWAQTEDRLAEDGFAAVFGQANDSDKNTDPIRCLLDAVQRGQFAGGQGDDRFFVLGLAPNAARIAVRFWHAAPFHVIAEKIRQWFEDLRLVHAPHEPEYPSLFRLLCACAVLNKVENIPPALGGDIMRSILSGSPFPPGWLNAAVIRCRAEQDVGYLRAAVIKACLNRLLRRQNDPSEKEFLPMLDLDNLNPAYRLGRLFATLEKIQEEASSRNLNRTIRESHYGAASSSPASVFATLLRLKNHHLAKIDPGRTINLERRLGEIMNGLDDFPRHLSLQEQARFALGYYHQRQDFFKKPASTETPEGETP